MTEEPPSNSQDKSWFEKVVKSFSGEPKSREELLDIIEHAAHNRLLDQEALEIIQGALEVSDQQVREIMIPRSKMVVVSLSSSTEEFLPKIIESGHSRFPVIGETIDDIKGILLAKDLLPLVLQDHSDFALESVIRPANVIPESKRLNVLLREFRENRYHMALVIDEYGGISGLITIEDILEEIVGDIEDETDEEHEDGFIRKVNDNDYIVKALTPITEFNEKFDANLSDQEFDTIGGLLTQAFGYLPQRNEMVNLDGYDFRVLYANKRQIHSLRLTLPQENEQEESTAE